MTALRLEAGEPHTLGAVVRPDGVNFAVFSRDAEGVDLCIFDAAGLRQTARLALPARTGDIWHGFLPGAGAGLVYGYRAHGRYDPSRGLRFNAAKLLLDPYALALAGAFAWRAEHYGYKLETGDVDGAPDERDNAAWTQKAIVVDPARLAPLRRGPSTPWPHIVLYELHVRGFTMRLPGLSASERGRFAGLSSAAALDYLRALGVTTLELLPIHAFLDDHRLVDHGLRNYWGYNTIGYFTPHPAYAGADPIGEMRAFVDAAHDHGMEVALDVVYNHTCEGDPRGPTLSFRGLDNRAYYRLDPNNGARYDDLSGCGATLDMRTPAVRRLALDSLSHFVSAYGVDGFRFDIATSLAVSDNHRFDPNAPFFQELAARTDLNGVKLIAEPWDAAGGFHLGAFPPGWAEWNAKARDGFRRFWRGDPRHAGEFARRLAGSADLFSPSARAPWASINFAACHDGFTLADLTTYAHKRNAANNEGNRDGPSDDFSASYGPDGPSTDAALRDLRERQARNLLLSVMLSFGAPMLLAGDEFGRTQGGNNNAYCQDNEVSWLDWSLATSETGARMVRFARRLIALRRSLACFDEGVAPKPPGQSDAPTIDWRRPDGEPMDPHDWDNPDVRSFMAIVADQRGALPALLAFNAGDRSVRFRLPATPVARWSSALDTLDPDRPAGALVAAAGEWVDAPSRSAFVFVPMSGRRAGVPGHAF